MVALEDIELFIQESLDAHLGCFLEGFVEHFYLSYFAVGGERFVGFFADLCRQCCAGVVVHVFGQVAIDEGHNLSFSVNDNAFVNILAVVQYRLHLFGVDVLPRGVEYHRLDASANEDVAVLVHHAQVAGAEPAVAGERGLGGFGVFVVAYGEVGAAGLYLAGLALRVVAVDAHLMHWLAA